MKRKALRVRSKGSIHPYVTEAESRKQHSDSPLCNSLIRAHPDCTRPMHPTTTPLETATALLAQLEQRREPSYARFMALRTKVSSRPESVLGIRMKWLRQASKQLSRLLTLDEAIELLHPRARVWYEYKILFGGVLGRLATAAEGTPLLYPLCDGWAVPDYYKEILAQWARQGDAELQIVLRSLAEHAHDANPYARRLTVVAWLDLLRYDLVTPTTALQHIIPLQHDEAYYVQMAMAWLLAEMTLTGESSLVEAISTTITDSTVLRMYQQKLRDSRRTATRHTP